MLRVQKVLNVYKSSMELKDKNSSTRNANEKYHKPVEATKKSFQAILKQALEKNAH